MLIINAFIYILLISIYTLTIIGYGAKFKKIFFYSDENRIGEFGLYGFVVLYFLSIIIHFFFPINAFVSSLIISIGIYFFFKEVNSKKIKFLFNKKIILIFLVFLLLSLTNQFHEDAYLYQLPYVNYVQKFKIIFGLITINDYLGYGHGFYDVLALFNLPIISNTFIFILPLIFLSFFIIYLYEQKNTSNFYVKTFFTIIISVLCLRYYQSKDYGTDLPVLIFIFLIQINLINFLFNRDIHNIYKSLLYLVTGIFFKIYIIFSVFYFLPFLLLIKFKKKHILKFKKIIFFFFIITLLSIGKNFIHSGCLLYPIYQTCFESKNISWSYGKDLSKKRFTFLQANNKGWMAHYRFVEKSRFLKPEDYLKKFKYNYFKNLIYDQDIWHLVLNILIILILISCKKNIRLQGNKVKNLKFSTINKKYLLIVSSLSFLTWLFLSPQMRYGGYAFFSFFLFSSLIYFDLIKNLDFRKIKFFIFITLSFLIFKNFDRLKNEINDGSFTLIPKYKYISYNSSNKFTQTINISENIKFCGNIEMLCILKSNFSSIKDIKNRYGYLYILKEKNAVLKHMNFEIKQFKKN